MGVPPVRNRGASIRPRTCGVPAGAWARRPCHTMIFSIFPKFLAHLTVPQLAAAVREAGLDTTNLVVRDGYWMSRSNFHDALQKFMSAAVRRASRRMGETPMPHNDVQHIPDVPGEPDRAAACRGRARGWTRHVEPRRARRLVSEPLELS